MARAAEREITGRFVSPRRKSLHDQPGCPTQSPRIRSPSEPASSRHVIDISRWHMMNPYRPGEAEGDSLGASASNEVPRCFVVFACLTGLCVIARAILYVGYPGPGAVGGLILPLALVFGTFAIVLGLVFAAGRWLGMAPVQGDRNGAFSGSAHRR